MRVPYRIACWVVGWIAAIVVLALAWGDKTCADDHENIGYGHGDSYSGLGDATVREGEGR